MNLSNLQQNLSVIAALEAKGDMEGLRVALNKALDSGVTLNETKEALSQLYAYTGFPRSLNAINLLQEIVAERQEAGLRVDIGRDADPLPEDFNALQEGTEVQTKLIGQPVNLSFVPQTDYYLKAHLFGDIFARNTLTHPDREVVTVSALAALEGCESQLGSHIAGALNVGVTKEMLREIPALLAAGVGNAEAQRLSKALAQSFGEEYTPVEYIDMKLWPLGGLNPVIQYFSSTSFYAEMDGDLANVTFEPGCRNNWHVHHGQVQVLICVQGRGWYQEWGKPAVPMVPGTVIAIPALTKHWHGAAEDSWFQHLTYHTDMEEGAYHEWLEPVSDEEYKALH